MAGELRIRQAHDADLPAILELMTLALGSDMPRDPAFFTWKHLHNPFGRSLMLVGEDDDGLVGLRAMMRWEFERNGQLVQAVRPVDTATHPRFRRRGLFTRLTRQILAELGDHGIDLIFNTPNDKSRPGYLKMGWRSVGVLPVWIRPGGRFAVRGSHAMVGALTEARHLDARLATHRKPAYFGWRYSDAPGLSYTLHGDGRSGIVTRMRDRGGRAELSVPEVVVHRKRDVPRVASILRNAVRNSTADYALAMASADTREAAVLMLAGFVPVAKRGPHLVARAINGRPVPPGLFEPRAWRVQIGDLEVF